MSSYLSDTTLALLGRLFSRARQPIPSACTYLQLRLQYAHLDFVKASLEILAHGVRQQILAVQFLADLGQRVLQPALSLVRVLLAAGVSRVDLQRIGNENRFRGDENLLETRH